MNMMDNKVGRNDPCPCGSGRKYKKCCLQNESIEGRKGAGPAAGASDDLREAMEGQDFGSMEEMQAFVEQHTQQRNSAPMDDFHGLSPSQMHPLLNQPFSSPQLVTFFDGLDDVPSAPIMMLFGLLVDALDEKGLKPTAKGNLPRNFCREAALSYINEEGDQRFVRFGKINKEEDFFDLHIVRLVAEMAGLIRKHKGRFILSSECRKLLAESGMSAIYPRLFMAYVESFNWAYRDRFPDIPFIQQSFLFTLYLLYHYNDSKRLMSFYEEAYINAFPMLLDEFGENEYIKPERELAFCYSCRSLTGFSAFLGLVRLEKCMPNDHFDHEYRVVNLPLLHQVVQFHQGL